MEILDIRSLQKDLDDVLRVAMADGKGALRRAATVLERARTASPAGERPPSGPWFAIRLDEDQILCWEESDTAVVLGRWEGSDLDLIHVAVDGQSWSQRSTPEGESRASSDGRLEGPADTRLFADIRQRAGERLREWEREHARRSWSCPRCAWNNADDDAACRMCGVPAGGGSPGPAGWTPEEPVPEYALTQILELPPRKPPVSAEPARPPVAAPAAVPVPMSIPARGVTRSGTRTVLAAGWLFLLPVLLLSSVYYGLGSKVLVLCVLLLAFGAMRARSLPTVWFFAVAIILTIAGLWGMETLAVPWWLASCVRLIGIAAGIGGILGLLWQLLRRRA